MTSLRPLSTLFNVTACTILEKPRPSYAVRLSTARGRGGWRIPYRWLRLHPISSPIQSNLASRRVRSSRSEGRACTVDADSLAYNNYVVESMRDNRLFSLVLVPLHSSFSWKPLAQAIINAKPMILLVDSAISVAELDPDGTGRVLGLSSLHCRKPFVSTRARWGRQRRPAIVSVRWKLWTELPGASKHSGFSTPYAIADLWNSTRGSSKSLTPWVRRWDIVDGRMSPWKLIL